MDYDNTIKEIKKDFFSLRNGLVADSLKKIYPEGKIIYGLNAPQLMEVSKKYPHDLELALILWEDKRCRESRLLSLYLLPGKELTPGIALEMIKDVDSVEEAEFLAFRVLRNLPNAQEFYKDIAEDKNFSSNTAHCIKMFKKNLDAVSEA